jgi:nucleotide-binding universal stress UspA family protein
MPLNDPARRPLGRESQVWYDDDKGGYGIEMYKRVLLPLDGSQVAEQALPHAVAQAEHFGAELILLRVVEPFPPVRGLSHADLGRIWEQTQEWAHEYLDGIAESPKQRGISVITTTVEGQSGAAILQFAEANQVDLIVICTRGRSGVSRWLMGSVADRVTRGARMPVLLVQATHEEAQES